VTIYQFQPHAHLRGKDFTYSVVYPDGREQPSLTVPKYDFHWQLAYDLDQPLRLPAGSKLVVRAHYDNSDKNENLMHHHGHGGDPDHAPGPQKEVYFREMNQSWDEMFTPFIQYAIDHVDSAAPENALRVVEVLGCLEQGPSNSWMLTHASEPVVSKTQTTSSEAVKAATDRPLGNLRNLLLGVDEFRPLGEKGQKVEVKGVLIKAGTESRINVTSLQPAGSGCL